VGPGNEAGEGPGATALRGNLKTFNLLDFAEPLEPQSPVEILDLRHFLRLTSSLLEDEDRSLGAVALLGLLRLGRDDFCVISTRRSCRAMRRSSAGASSAIRFSYTSRAKGVIGDLFVRDGAAPPIVRKLRCGCSRT